MENQDYITPTKQYPVFTAECDHFGFIEEPLYKSFLVEDNEGSGSIGHTFALDFTNAIIRLHAWIKNNPHVVNEFPKCKFNLYLINGTIDKKLCQRHEEKVYSISAKKAKKLLLS